MKHLVLALGAAALLGPRPVTAQGYPGTDIFLARFADRDSLTLDEASFTNATARPGYDNQPQFTPDGRGLLYSSAREGQTDIFRLDLERGIAEPLTRTPESEFSPSVLPDGSGISVVRVEADSTQRLWRFPWVGGPGAGVAGGSAAGSAAKSAGGSAAGEPRPILDLVRGVGYYAWADTHRVALFLLGTPHTLHIGDLRDGTTKLAAQDIGRSMHKIPGRNAVSFLQIEGSARWIKEYDLASGEIRSLAPALEGSEDYAWTPDGRMLMAQGTILTVWNPQGEGSWEVVQGLGPLLPGKISRLAVSPDGSRLALVVDEPAAP